MSLATKMISPCVVFTIPRFKIFEDNLSVKPIFLPSRYSLSCRSKVEAMKLAVSIVPVGPTTIPFGLTR